MANKYETDLQWMRGCSLIVADASGQGLELGELRVTFKISKGELQTPNTARIRIYNLAEATTVAMQREFTSVYLQAGYLGNIGLVFSGSITQFRMGVENGVDRWLEINAADGDLAYNWATLNTTLAAGSTPQEHIAVCGAAMREKGLAAGDMPEQPGNPLPRGKVMYGQAKKFMRQACAEAGSSWSIQNGQLQVIRDDGYLPGEAVALTYETGLVGTPEQTNKGIKARCLINPRIRIGGRIRLNNRSITLAMANPITGTVGMPSLDRDGFYRVLTQDISGDTRGSDWYIDNLCVGLDDTARTPLDMEAS